MIAKARGKYLTVTPRKVRSIIRVVKGMDVVSAQILLGQMPKRASGVVLKVLNSALSNASQGGTWTPEQLTISGIWADEGPALRRFKAGSMGRAMPRDKKMTHLSVELDVKGKKGNRKGNRNGK